METIDMTGQFILMMGGWIAIFLIAILITSGIYFIRDGMKF